MYCFSASSYKSQVVKSLDHAHPDVSPHTSSFCTGISFALDCASVNNLFPYLCVAKLMARSLTELCLRTSRSTYSAGRLANVAEVSFPYDLYLELYAWYELYP